MPEFTLTLLGSDNATLNSHLFCGDGKESAAIGLCSIAASTDPHRILLRELIPVPNSICIDRTDVSISWPVEWLDPLLARAEADGLSIVKFHCHPGEQAFFSRADDTSDAALFDGIHGFLDNEAVHGSVVVLPSGRMLGRAVLADGSFVSMRKITVLDREPAVWFHPDDQRDNSVASVGRHARGFGQEMRRELSKLSIGVIGVSGTGSIVVEQLARLNVGKLVLVDPEFVEDKNLDRILNADANAAANKVPKVALASRAIKALGFGTKVEEFPVSIVDREAVTAIAGCDIVFGCVDGAEGRSVLDRIAASQLQLLIDVGVGAEADVEGAIDQIDLAIHVVVPGNSSLLSRGVYTPEQVHAEVMKRVVPEVYAQLRAEKYIKGRDGEQPAVISINMMAASNAVMELLARFYPYRHEPDIRRFDVVRINLAEMEYVTEMIEMPCATMTKLLARGNVEPLLNMPQLSPRPPA